MKYYQRLDCFQKKQNHSFLANLRAVLWYLTARQLVSSIIPGHFWRKKLLQLFGAQFGHGGNLKPRITIACPWNLFIGDHCWIGENVWIDNLADVKVGDHVCISQGVYICTGNHDYRRISFDVFLRPVSIESQAWVCARATIAPGSCIRFGAVVSLGAVVNGEVPPGAIVHGNPSHSFKFR